MGISRNIEEEVGRRIFTDVGVIGGNIGRSGLNLDRGGKVDLLPAARGFVGEGGAGEQASRRELQRSPYACRYSADPCRIGSR